MNNVVLIGRLTKDPEFSQPNSETSVAKFTLAVDREGKNKDQADFIRITCFNGQAETVNKYLSKGRQVAVLGRIQTGSYTDKEGKTVYTTDVLANRIEFLGSPNSGGGNSNQAKPEPTSEESAIDEAATDVPF